MGHRDTIVAVATPPGRGGVAVVRVSGSAVPHIASTLLGALPLPRFATFSRWHDAAGELIDVGLALYFPAPHSFTGEPVLELQGHGGDVVVSALIERIVELGARRARAGEFSERAFLNDKIDLAQAEAIADLVDAGSRRAAQAALRSLQGEFSKAVNATRAALVSLRVYVEAAIDFPEEEIDFLASAELRERLEDVQQQLSAVLAAAEQGAALTRGLTVAIAGRPNAGKSTLMNRLAGHEVAIVTPVAGTTRDLLRERIEIDGVPVELIDTAGLRAATSDAIEAEGMRRARDAIARADHVLFVIDTAADPRAQSFASERSGLPAGVPVTLVMNKSDLVAPAASATPPAADTPRRIFISAVTGDGIPALRAALVSSAGQSDAGPGAFSARARHVDALRRAAQHLALARAQLQSKQGELAAFELRAAQQELGEVVGDVTSDELLGHIFGSFCIGK
ncbi:MAG: tRNA uridine-5-carboxymethylaminomethyl(34) synthesis GTPase MnmE [Steroidobacteraceae bacterium]